MLLGITTNAYSDILRQLSRLVRDPVYYGVGVPRGHKQPVLLIPGFTAGDWSLGTMARWLARIGYRPYLSGIDLNVGCPQAKVQMMGLRLQQIAREEGVPVTIVGHSLGGILGRALAQMYPETVRGVVALGAPMRMEWDSMRDEVRPLMQALQRFWQLVSTSPEECGTHQCPCGFGQALRDSAGAAGGVDSIFTRGDEVVEWEECLVDAGNNHEVSGGHLSLIFNREVYRIVAAILARGAETGD